MDALLKLELGISDTKTMTGFDHSIYYINVLLAINFISVRNHFVVFAARENLIKL